MATHRAAEGAPRDKVEEQPQRVEAVPADEFSAFVMWLVGFDNNVRVLWIIWRETVVDVLEAQRTDLVVIGLAHLERGNLCAGGLWDIVVFQHFLQPLDDAKLGLQEFLLDGQPRFQLSDLPSGPYLIQLHLKHPGLQFALHRTAPVLGIHEGALPLAGVHDVEQFFF